VSGKYCWELACAREDFQPSALTRNINETNKIERDLGVTYLLYAVNWLSTIGFSR
jgi:hypothetical protein